MAVFIEATDLSKLPPGRGATVTLSGKEIALFNVEGTVYAIADTCPHAGGSLGMGKLDGRIVACPVHGMKFDVSTGCFSGSWESGVASCPVKVVDGKIMVALCPTDKKG